MSKDDKLLIQILRTTQRDDEVINDINQSFINILLKLRINKLSFKQNRRIENVSKFLYYMLTSLSCLQTLGEEYTGLIRVDSTKKFLPSKPIHIFWLILETFGESISHRLLEHLEKHIIDNDDLLPDAKQAILASVRFFKNCLPFIVKLQKAEFYLNGHYPDIPKRITSINYRCVHPIYDEHNSSSLFKLLGILTLINFGINVCTKMNVWKSSAKNHSEASPSLDNTQTNLQTYTKCILCLEPRKNDCVTQCGHIFCWKCIGDWSKVRKECPICREVIVPSRIIYLQNYI